MDPELLTIIYVAVALLAVAGSSLLNWKKNNTDNESFDVAKFLSAYMRTAWGLIPLVLGMVSMGLNVTAILAIIGLAFGLDNIILKASK